MIDVNKINPQSLLIHDPAFKLLSSKARPDFMLIGSAKCGTTSFSSYLSLHPQVKACVPKEPNFWSWKNCTRDQYQQLFVNPGAPTHPGRAALVGGEYSTSYLLHPLVPRRVAARLPDVKLLVLLRNPADRAYSHYIMASRNGSEPDCSFDEIVEREIEEVPRLCEAHRRGFLDTNFRSSAHRLLPNGTPISVASHTAQRQYYPLINEQSLFKFYVTSYVFRSIYYDQLWRWLQLFPREQIKIIESNQLMKNRALVMSDVVEFLHLKPHDFGSAAIQHTWGGGANEHNTPGDYAPMSNATRLRLEKFFVPHNRKLFSLVGEEFDWGVCM